MKRFTLRYGALSLLALLAACSPSGTAQKQEALVISGSDTEVQMVSSLVEEFLKTNPDGNISVAGGGSAVGIAALINGETDIANSSRKMKQEELDKAKTNGKDAKEFVLARDGLSVVVHPSNPLTKLTMKQLGDIYSGKVTNWKDFGGPDLEISLYGRQSTSGTFGFFRDTVVKGDYATSMRQMEGTQAIVDGVADDKSGIGYSGVGYVKDAAGAQRTDIKVLLVSKDDASTAYSPLDKAAIESLNYPILRQIFQYLPGTPAKGSLAEKFLRFEVSAEGQAIAEKSGFYAINASDKTQNDAFFAAIK